MDIRIIKKKELKRYAEIAFNAYPGFGAPDVDKVSEFLTKVLEGENAPVPWGVFDKGIMIGGMLIYDFEMNFRLKIVKAKGVGLVAVDLTRKKEKVCMEMIRYFIGHAREEGASFALLYPFRPDFYRKMGFGYSSSLKKFRIRTGSFPKSGKKEGLRFAVKDDIGRLLEFYNRQVLLCHGMTKRSSQEFERLFKGKLKTVIHEAGGRIDGYVSFGFKKGHENNFTVNDLIIREMIVSENNPAAACALYSFINSQSDQATWTEITTFDEELYHLLNDPRDKTGEILSGVYHDSFRGGVGLMGRFTDPGGLVSMLSGAEMGEMDLDVLFRVSDAFEDTEAEEYAVRFSGGKAEVCSEDSFDIVLEAGSAAFSSIVMGALSVRKACAMGLASIGSGQDTKALDVIFRTSEKPCCLAEF